MAQRKQWVRRVGTAATVAAAMTATTLVAGGTSASAATGCRVEVTANTPTKSGSRIIYTGSYRVSSCTASFVVELRVHRGASQISTYRFNSSAPMSGVSSLRSSTTCTGTGRWHTELVVLGAGFTGHASSGETGRYAC